MPPAGRAATIPAPAQRTSMSSVDRADLRFAIQRSLSTGVQSSRSKRRNNRLHRLHQSIFPMGILNCWQRQKKRLRALERRCIPIPGPASLAIPQIVHRLDPSGLHLAFLDPHNLGTLSFDLFESLAKLKRIDIIVHVSLSDLQRNADRYTSAAHNQFDKFAPGWRDHVGTDMNQEALRRAIIQYWSDRVMALQLPRAKHCELIRGSQGQRLYWLILLARHKLAHSLWSKISSSAKNPELDF